MSFSFGDWRVIGVAVLTVLIFGYIGVLKYQLASCANRYLELQLSTSQQNNAIRLLADKNIDMGKQIEKDLDTADKAGAKHENKARAYPSVPVSKEECRAFKDLIREQRK